jgi:hypothetical protein
MGGDAAYNVSVLVTGSPSKKARSSFTFETSTVLSELTTTMHKHAKSSAKKHS